MPSLLKQASTSTTSNSSSPRKSSSTSSKSSSSSSMMNLLGSVMVCLGSNSTMENILDDDNNDDINNIDNDNNDSGENETNGNHEHDARNDKNSKHEKHGRNERNNPNNPNNPNEMYEPRIGLGGCMVPLRSRYAPNDAAEELKTMGGGGDESVMLRLEGVVPQLLECITASPPDFSVEEALTTTSTPRSTPKMMRKSIKEFYAKRSDALQKLYELTKKGNEQNRIPLCHPKWKLVPILSNALSASIDNTTTNSNDSDNVDTQNHPKTEKETASTPPTTLDEDRRLLCWILNNLSIPYENKRVMVLGPHSQLLLTTLTRVIGSGLPESYLCCICVMNLTYLAEAVRVVTLFVPGYDLTFGSSLKSTKSMKTPPRNMLRSSSLNVRSRSASGVGKLSENSFSPNKIDAPHSESLSEDCGPALENPSSLLRTIERMMIINAPFLLSKVQSVQGEAIRWACGFIRNVTFPGNNNGNDGNANGAANGRNRGQNEVNTSSICDPLSTGQLGQIPPSQPQELCTLLSRTRIPHLLLQFLTTSPHPPIKWTKDSLEDICLGIMCNLAQFGSSREALRGAGAVKGLEGIEGVVGIHGYRARAIRCSLGALPMQFG